MAENELRTFLARHRPGDALVSICMNCFATIGGVSSERELKEAEEVHACEAGQKTTHSPAR